MRKTSLLLLLAAALLAGCGGGGGGSPADASSLVPADALGYISLDTDSSAPQLENVVSLVGRIPLAASALTRLGTAVAPGGADLTTLLRSAGPRVDIAFLEVGGATQAVGLTKPKDEKSFDAQLARNRLVHATLSGWTVFSRSQAALDTVRSRSASLADGKAFAAALATLPGPGDAFARAYVSAAGARSLSLPAQVRWVAAAVTGKRDALLLELHAKGAPGITGGPSSPELESQLPSGALAALSFGRGVQVPAAAVKQLGGVTKLLGFDLTRMPAILGGPFIAYAGGGIPVPEVTIAALPADPSRAEAAVGRLLAPVADGRTPTTVQVDGVTLKQLDLGVISLYYGTFGRELVVTDTRDAVGRLRTGGAKLEDDDAFKAAAGAAGLPDTRQGIVYLDVQNGLPVLHGVLSVLNAKLPASVESNLKPLRTVLAYVSREGDAQTLVAYLQVS